MGERNDGPARRRVAARAGRLTRAWAVLRIGGLGLTALAAPRAATTFRVGPAACTPAGAVLGRGLGGRDLALGAGTPAAGRSGGPVRPWVVSAGFADALDAPTTAAARPALPARRRDLVIAASAGSALLATVLSAGLRPPAPGGGPRRIADGR